MELRILLGGLRRARLLILVLAVLGAAAGIALTSSDPSPSATTAVFLGPPKDFIGDPDRYVEGEMAVIRSAPVASAAVALVPGTDTDGIQSSLDVSQRAGSDVVDITASAADEGQAVAVAAAVAEAYLQQHRTSSAQEQQQNLDAANATLTDLHNQLDALSAQLTGGAGDAPIQAQIAVTQALLDDALRERSNAAAAVDAATDDRTAVVEPAAADAHVGGKRDKYLLPILGFLGGAGLGALIGVLRVLTAPRLQTRRQAEYLVGRPALAEITSPSPLQVELNSFASFESMESLGDLSVALRPVAAAVASHPVRAEPRTVAVVDPEGSVGGHQIAAALATVFSEDHHRVALIPVGTWRVESQEQRVKTALARARQPGLPAIRDERGVDLGGWEAVYVARNRCIVTPWESNAGPLDSRRLAELRTALEPHFDVVVLALPPVLESPAAASAAGHADDAVLVVPVPDQDEAQLTRVLDLLDGPDGPGIHLVVARSGQFVRRVLRT